MAKTITIILLAVIPAIIFIAKLIQLAQQIGS